MSLIRSLQVCFQLIWIGLLTGMCGALAADNPQSNRANLRKRASFAITGVQTGRQANGVAPPRLEIRKLRQNNAQWNLYLLALNDFYNKTQTDLTSYYQVAGIHGRPFTTWDGVAFTKGQNTGYCPHSSTLFPTWHRPYLALYEQVLYGLVQAQARTFNSNEYTQAALTFRVPYWDWAAPAGSGNHVLPETISGSASIQITLPTGPKTINNPLFQYHFHPVTSNDFPDDPFDYWPNTLRYPNSDENPNAQSQNPLVVSEMDQSQASFSQRFIVLLQAYSSYSNFSNKAWIPNSANNYDSLESLHDQIHGLVGINGGHMAYLEYSAFDPIFWLHHTNVDRLFAIWQAIYPNTWITAGKATSETATIKKGNTLDTNTPLKPFHKTSSGQFWTSASSRNVDAFGYTYPELQPGDVASVKRAVNALYSGSAGSSVKRRDANDKTYTEWIANLRVAQGALGSTFFIHIFLGEFRSDPAFWSLDPSLVGTHTIFKSYLNSTSDPDLIITGTIPLTRALRRDADAGKLNFKDEKAVETYLTQNLHWRITDVHGAEVARENVQNLKVSVVSSVVTKAVNDYEFPTWGPFIVHQDITDGRPAGLKYGDRT